MTDLSTTNLKRLLDEATPGPWRISLTEGISGLGFAEDFYQDDPREKANVTLAAAAPDLAQEALRLREELIDWANDEARAHNALVKRAQEAGGAGIITTHKTIYNRIWEILGEINE